MEWKRMVRYMYEYENDRKVRNTGFVRFDLGGKVCRAYIHGKGIHAEDTCNIYAFYESDDAIVRILLGYVRMKNGSLDGYVEMDSEHVGDTDIPFDRIVGLMIGENRERRYLVFLKSERSVGSMEDALKPGPREEGEAARMKRELEEAAAVTLEEAEGVSAAHEETAAVSVPCEEEEAASAPREEEKAVSAPREEGKAASAPRQTEESDMTSSEKPENDAVEIMEDLPPETEEIVSEEFDYRRIGPRDLGILRRQDRHLANNSFLLHGYYNYRHLILSEDGDHYILGVPGVYMEREKRAASMFGFPQFMEAEEYGIPVPMEAREHKAVFGYWCRHLPRK